MVDLALLDAPTRRSILDADLDDVADVRISALAAAEHLNAHHPPGPGVVGDLQDRLHLDHYYTSNLTCPLAPQVSFGTRLGMTAAGHGWNPSSAAGESISMAGFMLVRNSADTSRRCKVPEFRRERRLDKARGGEKPECTNDVHEDFEAQSNKVMPSAAGNRASCLDDLGLLDQSLHPPRLGLGELATCLDLDQIAFLELVVLVMGVILLRPGHDLAIQRVLDPTLDQHGHRLVHLVAHHAPDLGLDQAALDVRPRRHALRGVRLNGFA